LQITILADTGGVHHLLPPPEGEVPPGMAGDPIVDPEDRRTETIRRQLEIQKPEAARRGVGVDPAVGVI
jgi:hypothetical protein